MTEQQFTESRTEAVAELRYSGDPEQDHLIDAIQHPEVEEALWAMPSRPPSE